MKQTIISVVKVDNKGMVVSFGGDTRDNLEAIGMTLAAAVASMAEGGTPAEVIEQQIKICVDYGMERGMKRARRV